MGMPGLVLTPKQRAELEAHQLRITNMKHQIGEQLGQHITIKDVQLAKWWCGHVLHIREYVKEYPSHSLIELDLYDTNETESLLYHLFQADTNAYHLHRKAKSNEGARSSQEHVPTPTPTPQKQCFWGHSNQGSFLQRSDTH